MNDSSQSSHSCSNLHRELKLTALPPFGQQGGRCVDASDGGLESFFGDLGLDSDSSTTDSDSDSSTIDSDSDSTRSSLGDSDSDLDSRTD